MKRLIGCALCFGLLLCAATTHAQWALSLLDTLQLPSAGHGLSGTDSALYVACGDSGLVVIESCRPDSLYELSRFRSTGFTVTSVVQPVSHTLFVADSAEIAVLDIANPHWPGIVCAFDFVTFVPVPTSLLDVQLAVGDRVLSLQSSPEAIDYITLGDPCHPALLYPPIVDATIYLKNTVDGSAVYLLGHRAVIGWIFTLASIDSANGGMAFHFHGSCNLDGRGREVFAQNGYAYIGTGDELVVVDARDPAQPVVVGRAPLQTDAEHLRIRPLPNAVAVLSIRASSSSFEIFDMTDVAHPQSLAIDSVPGEAGGLWTVDSTLFITAADILYSFRYGAPLPDFTTAPDPVAAAFGLERAYPNPFNAMTTLAYSLAQPGAVDLSVFDLQGRLTATLVREPRAAGRHTVKWDAAAVPSGTYFVRLQSGPRIDTQKLLLLK